MLTQDEDFRRAILGALNTQPGIRLAILFGSLAACQERADSDLDLAVDVGHRLLPRLFSNQLTGLAELRTT